MENNPQFDTPARAGTIGGTLIVLLLHISSEELLKTAVLAALGAAVSFGVSFLLGRITKRRKTG
jgi:urea transporter